METKYKVRLIQRDPRTSLLLKQAYVGMCLFMSVLTAVTLGGGFYIHQECTSFGDNTLAKDWSATWRIWFYVFIGFVVLYMVFVMYFLICYKWAWLTRTFYVERFGEDVEDLDPFILSREGSKLATDASETVNKIYQEVDKTYDQVSRYQPP